MLGPNLLRDDYLFKSLIRAIEHGMYSSKVDGAAVCEKAQHAGSTLLPRPGLPGVGKSLGSDPAWRAYPVRACQVNLMERTALAKDRQEG